jgi:FG-GAP-like repeat
VTLARGLQNRCGLEFKRYVSIVSRAKDFLQFSVCTALMVVAALSDAYGQISYSLPIPVFPLAPADNGELLGGPMVKVIVDINGDGFQDAIYHLFAQGQLRDHAVPTPIVILLNDRRGGFYDGTSEMIVGPPPKALFVKNFTVEDFNGDGRLDIFVSNTGPEIPVSDSSQWPGEQNQLFLSASDGKLHDMTATHLPQIKEYSHGSAAADVDGDGDIDIWVNNLGPGTGGPIEAYLMLNDGTGRFTIVAQAGSGFLPPHVGFNGRLPEELGRSFAAYTAFFADIDNDGDPDLIMWALKFFNGTNETRMVVLINDGTGRFSISPPDVLPFSPFGGEGAVEHAVAEDLNLDGYTDFIVGVIARGPAGLGRYFQVLINNGNGTFSDQTATRLPGQSEALKNQLNPPFHFLADLDGDGDKDLLAKFFADDLAPGQMCCPPEMWKTEFYRNDGKGFFTGLPEGDYFNIHPNFLPLDVDQDGITDFFNAAAFNFFFTGQVWADFIKATGPPRSLFAATLPSSRSVLVGQAATFFATVINAGAADAIGCVIDKLSGVKGILSFQATDPTSNVPVGLPNTPVTIAAGGSQTFVVSVTPTAQFNSTEFAVYFGCANTQTAQSRKGLNTVLLSASLTPIPDIVALAATSSNDGIVNIPGTNGTGAFAVATVNVGAPGTITASADAGGLTLPVNISLCQTDPVTGQCISTIGPTVNTQINANATPTFGIFVQGNGNLPFDPATNRVFVRFKDAGGVTRGSTSVAVRTQ